MLCLKSWLGGLPTRLGRYSHKLQVFSKLGGNLLGFFEKPCLQSLQDASKAYTMLRDMQAHAALLLKHTYLPSRYLALHVGNHRLTSQNFPFVECLEQEQVDLLNALHGTNRIDVVYDGGTDFGVARAELEAKGLSVVYSPRIDEDLHAVEVSKTASNYAPKSTLFKLVQPELDVWAFNMNVQYLGFHYPAPSIGDLHHFPGLKSLMLYPRCCVQKVSFSSLASTCKSLEKVATRN